MKNVIIFGGAGFIGTNLIKSLLKDGHKVMCIDNLFTGRLKNLKDFVHYEDDRKFVFYKGDITDNNLFVQDIYDKINYFFGNKKVDEIYNLACPASPPKYLIDPIFTIHTSLAIENICLLVQKLDCKLLHASTSEVYGNPDIIHHPQNELYNGNVNILGPRSCYDEGKRIAETILYEYHKRGVKCKIIRIFNTYGPYMDPDDGRVISNFICQALRNEDITIYGNGLQTRSFQYIDNLIYGIKKFMDIDDYFGPINIGNPEEFTIKELADLVLEMIPESKSKIVYMDLPKDDPIQRKADISRAVILFNYDPTIKLKEGLMKTINYFKNEIKLDN